MFSTGGLVSLFAATAATEGMLSIREVARCVCLTRGDCRDRGNAQHSRGWLVAYVLPAATAATEGMRSIREVGELPDIENGMPIKTSRFIHNLMQA